MTMKEHVKISWRVTMPNGNYLEFWNEDDAKAFDQMLDERYRAGAIDMRDRAAKGEWTLPPIEKDDQP